MPRQGLVPLCLVALCLLGVAAVATPVAADGTPTASLSNSAAQQGVNQTYNDTGLATLTRTDDGSVYLAGVSGNSGFGAAGPGGNATLVKRAPDGTTAWTLTEESTNTTVFVSVEPGPAGGVYALESSSNRSGGYSPPTISLVRVSASGDVRWRKPLSVRGVSGPNSLTAADGGGIVIANRTRSGLELLRYGPSGARTWTETYDVRASRVSVDATDDGYLLTGTVGFESPWIMRLDRTGEIQSNRTYPSTNVESVVDAVPTPDGGVVLVGSGGGFGATSSLAVGVGPDGEIRWSRVTGVGDDARVRDVVATDDGFVQLGGSGYTSSGPTAMTLTRVGFDGAVQSRTRVGGFLQATAVPGPEGRLTIAGLTQLRPSRTGPGQLQSAVRTVRLPAPDPDAARSLHADDQFSSGETHYRGQNLLVQSPRRAGETVDLVAIPDEYDDFDAHVARRVELNRSGMAVVETASLRRGRYVIEADDRPVFVESGSIVNPSSRESASFELTDHDIYSRPPRRGSESQYVDRAAGNTTASLTWESRRDDYVALVGFDRFRGERVNESVLDRVFADVDGFRGTATVNGQPVARIDADEEVDLSVPVTALEAGLYDVTIRGADTGEVGDPAQTRIVVGTTAPRPLSVSIGDEPVQVSVGNETRQNITLSGVTNGVGAMSVRAVREGQPGVRPGLRVEINGTRSSAGAGYGGGRATAEATSYDGNTSNGTITVGRFTVEAPPEEIDPDGNATNTVDFAVDWVIDEDGVPYTLPEPMTITVEVTDIENATGERVDGRHRGGHGSESGGGSGSGWASGSTSGGSSG
jgi:hypothetical protein